MRLLHLGDSYDIVKQSFLRWLAPLGEWSVHPMFTESVAQSQAELFAAFLGARLLSIAVLTPTTDRSKYLACNPSCRNLFLDPDTGVKLERVGGKRALAFLFADELASLAQARPEYLTMTFDQSHSHGGTRDSLARKLSHLASLGVAAFAYNSHACFIFASCHKETIIEARARILSDSRLPDSRLISQLPIRQVSVGAA
jgi:hypothetical protein